MSNIEEGEYVRTDIGNILKYEGKIKEYIDDFISISNKQDIEFLGKIVKHSKNIIDLIEVGDIIEINKRKYEVIYDKSFDKLGILIPNREELEVRHSSLRYIFSKTGRNEFNNITILTKEQYEQNCHKAGDIDE